MRGPRFLISIMLMLLALCPASLADDGGIPICSDAEFVDFFNMIVEHQVVFDGRIRNASELNRVSRAQMERRAWYQTQLPLCADAIAIQRLLIQLGGDSLGRAALELADLPAENNPYLQRLPDDQARIEALLSAMLGIDRADALPPAAREPLACAPADLTRLADAAAAFVEIADAASKAASRAESLASIDQLLLWRQENIPSLPKCAESVDLIQALSAAATDSAAYQALAYGGVSRERNPFPPLVEAGVAEVTDWIDAIQAEAASQGAPAEPGYPGSSGLPPCADAEVSAAVAGLGSDFTTLMARAYQLNAAADLLDYAAEQIAFRKRRLAQLPNCAEAFALRWFSAEALADAALRGAVPLGAPPSIMRGLAQNMDANETRAAAAATDLSDALADQDGLSLAPATSAAPACSDAERLFLFSYLIPKFSRFTDAALDLSQPQDARSLIERSYALRHLLWAYLPRCDDALEMGLLMRAVAADFVATLALELAGATVSEAVFIPEIAENMRQLFKRLEAFVSTCGALDGATITYYVVAENIANIRACASTDCWIVTTAHRGQRLDVVDDLSNWYEIVLPSCETAFIAGFLASQTPPPR